jgi:hypothetical protein
MSQTTLIVEKDLRDRFDLDGSSDADQADSAYPDARLLPSIRSASRRLRAWVGDTMYDAAVVQINSDPVPDDATLWELQTCESYLAMHYAVLGFNSPLTSKGVVQTAMSTEAKEVRRYLAPKEIEALSQMYLDQADEIKRQILATANVAPVPEPMPSVVTPPVTGEGATRGSWWCNPCERLVLYGETCGGCGRLSW